MGVVEEEHLDPVDTSRARSSSFSSVISRWLQARSARTRVLDVVRDTRPRTSSRAIGPARHQPAPAVAVAARVNFRPPSPISSLVVGWRRSRVAFTRGGGRAGTGLAACGRTQPDDRRIRRIVVVEVYRSSIGRGSRSTVAWNPRQIDPRKRIWGRSEIEQDTIVVTAARRPSGSSRHLLA